MVTPFRTGFMIDIESKVQQLYTHFWRLHLSDFGLSMSLQVDLVAAQLYLADAPLTHQLFQVAGDGNCFFRASSLALTGCTEGEHVSFESK